MSIVAATVGPHRRRATSRPGPRRSRPVRPHAVLLLSWLLAVPVFAGSSFHRAASPAGTPAALIRSSPVPADAIRTLEFGDASIRVTHAVPARFFGTYEYPVSRAPLPEYATRFILEPDGTGRQTDYACSDCEDPVEHFEWGLVVDRARLLVGHYIVSDADASGNVTRRRYRGHKIIFRYTDGDRAGFGHNVLYDDDGRLSLIGPHDQPVHRR